MTRSTGLNWYVFALFCICLCMPFDCMCLVGIVEYWAEPLGLPCTLCMAVNPAICMNE